MDYGMIRPIMHWIAVTDGVDVLDQDSYGAVADTVDLVFSIPRQDRFSSSLGASLFVSGPSRTIVPLSVTLNTLAPLSFPADHSEHHEPSPDSWSQDPSRMPFRLTTDQCLPISPLSVSLSSLTSTSDTCVPTAGAIRQISSRSTRKATW
jgi:hypothetical protein